MALDCFFANFSRFNFDFIGESEDITWRIDRFVQSLSALGRDLGEATAQEQGCEPGSDFAFLDLENQTSYATHYYRQKLQVISIVTHLKLCSL